MLKNSEVVTRAVHVAGVNEVCSSMREQLVALVEWAKNVAVFQEFTPSDQVTNADAVRH